MRQNVVVVEELRTDETEEVAEEVIISPLLFRRRFWRGF